jgi:hypothetical protein
MDHCICPSLRECVRWESHDAAIKADRDDMRPMTHAEWATTSLPRRLWITFKHLLRGDFA